MIDPYYEAECVTLYHGDCIDVMREMPDASVDAIVTDPPYGLGFMGKVWDAPSKMLGQISSRDGSATSGPLPTGNGTHSRGYADNDPRVFQQWCETWAVEALRVLKPGGHLAAFGGTRTYHRMACAIEDAGFEVRDCLAWMYGSGFPKSLDVSKAIDKAAGAERPIVGEWHAPGRGTRAPEQRYGLTAEHGTITAPATDAARQWEGWGTALKPAYEPIVLARKPLIGTVAANVLAHGTGAINVDGCRIGASGGTAAEPTKNASVSAYGDGLNGGGHIDIGMGRWPANVLMDEEAAAILDAEVGEAGGGFGVRGASEAYEGGRGFAGDMRDVGYGDRGGPSRFFYTAKASRAEREAGLDHIAPTRRSDGRETDIENPRLRTNARRNDHPTVKPVDLMAWLCRLVTPPGGLILDPFNGSGSTGMGALDGGFRYVGIEREEHYIETARYRIAHRHLTEVQTVEPSEDIPMGRLL